MEHNMLVCFTVIEPGIMFFLFYGSLSQESDVRVVSDFPKRLKSFSPNDLMFFKNANDLKR